MDKKCPVTGVNIPRFLISVIAGFIFVFAYDYIVHGIVLADIYAETPELWRGPENMIIAWMTAGQFLIVLITLFIFTRHYEDKGLAEGIRFGGMFGCLFAVTMAMPYAWMPISLLLAIYSAASGLMQGLGLGILYALTYRNA